MRAKQTSLFLHVSRLALEPTQTSLTLRKVASSWGLSLASILYNG